jgi:hypothetical protein
MAKKAKYYPKQRDREDIKSPLRTTLARILIVLLTALMLASIVLPSIIR